MKRSVIRILLPLLLVTGMLPASQAGTGTRPVPDGIPRPCFVPAHPQKQQQLPGLDRPLVDVRTTIPVGGASGSYRDDHLRLDPLGAQAPAPRTLRAIAILVDFDDEVMGASFEATPEDSTRLYFQRILMFLDEMYSEMSGGLVSIDGEVTPSIYRLPESMAYYGLDDSIATREAELCRDAVEAADADIDFTQYDRFLLFHAGAGQEADVLDNSREQIWSVFFRQIDFQFWLDAPDAEKGIRTQDIDPGNSGPFYVPNMVVLPEYESQDGFTFGMLGVVAHEFGHSFGLPDLYDTTAPEDFIFADSQGIGAFGLMGAGIWNDNGFFPSEMCAWSKFYAGWLRPRVIRPSETEDVFPQDLAAVEIDRLDGAVRIPLGGDEYFLIENRLHDPNGNGKLDFSDADQDGEFDFWDDSYAGAEFDWFLPQELGNPPPGLDGSGLLIWHVDESIVRDYLLYNLVNAEALHKGIDLEEADGIQDLDKLQFSFEAFGDPRDSFWAPYATAFTPFTTPSTAGYPDAYSGIRITDISGPGPNMTFTVRFNSASRDQVGDLRPGWPRDLPGRVLDFEPVTGDLDGNGVDEIILGVVDDAGMGGPVVLNLDGTSFFGGGAPSFASWGALNSDPVLIRFDGVNDPAPELAWVSGDTVYVRRGTGEYIAADGLDRSAPAPYFILASDPGRVRMSAGHVEPEAIGDGRPELLITERIDGGFLSTLAIAAPAGTSLTSRRLVSVPVPGIAAGYPTLANLDFIDNGLRELVTSVRTAEGGYLAVTLYDLIDADSRNFVDARTLALSLGDSVAFSSPVVGDLDRDGREEIVVADSEGYLHALAVRIQTADGTTKDAGGPPLTVIFNTSRFQELAGWPVPIGVLDGDAVSLADVDGDGYLEVLAMGGGNILHVINYNGTSILTLPIEVPGENRFTAPFLSPLVLDLTGDTAPELAIPLPDGQVRGHGLNGRALKGWAFLGGGNQGTHPVIADLDRDGRLELLSVEDITTSIPPDDPLDAGDESPGIPRRGRVMLRDVGGATAQGPWPVFRADAGRSGRAPAPSGEAVDLEGTLLADAFVMPNPVVGRATAGFHYRIQSEVETVTIEIFTATGQPVRTLNGSTFAYTDNLVDWDLTNDRGTPVAPGLYVARVSVESPAGSEVRTQRLVIVR